MYNRYTPNDQGIYERISMEDDRGHYHREPEHQATRPSDSPVDPPLPRQKAEETGGLLSGIFRKLRLDDIDTGDLLLLVILFLLFKDGEDEELLIALGLLLIL